MRRTPPKEIDPVDVPPSASLDDTQPVAPPADDTPAVIEAAPGVLLEGPVEVIPEQVVPEQVRIGGNPGVRVTQHGLTQHVRITGNTDAGVADHRPVPIDVLAQVRVLLFDSHGPLDLDDAPAAATLRVVRELLGPWLL